MWNSQIYGYRPKTNESYFPERIDGDVVVRKDDGIHGVNLYQSQLGAPNRIVLGNLARTAGNASACPDFTISFLFKFIYPLPVGESIRVIMTNPEAELRSNSNPVDIHFFQIAENVSFHAIVGKHNDVSDGARIDNLFTMDHWTHATVVYRDPHELETEIYINGSRVPADLYEINLIPELPDRKPYEYTIGGDQQFANLSLSWFQFFKGALSAEQVQNLSDDTISRALQANQVEVKFTITSLSVEEDVESVELLVTRSGNLEIASIVRFSALEGTAKLNKDFTFTSTDSVFEPGKVYRSIKVPILSDDFTEDDENLTISMASADGGVTTVTQGAVTITILSNIGPAGRESDAQSGADEECAVDVTTSCLLPLILLCVAIALVALGIIILLLFWLTLLSR